MAMKTGPSPCYEYIATNYGLVFREGDRVRVTEDCEERGRMGTVRRKRGRLHYLSVQLDGDKAAGEWHPQSLEVVNG